jgi:cephalosporin-C deacetylase-like acetyl esterase
MKTCLTTTVFAVFFCATTSMAGTFALDWATDNSPVSYLPGETMTFKIQLVEDGKPVAGKTLKWFRTGDDQKTAKGESVSSASEPLEIKTSIDKPGFVHLVVAVFDPDGKPLKNQQGQSLQFEGGVGVEPAKLESYPEPADFDAFWKSQKARLKQVLLKANLTKVASKNPKFQVFDVKVDCAGNRPVSGYLAIPKGAKAKSLPAEVHFQGYGVIGVDQEFHDGTIVFKINAHGIENGREPSYYQALEKGELHGYAFNNIENTKPETAYFNGMMLRVMRALEFVKSRPEWNGKTLAVSSGSQGGLQCLTAAALDSDVTYCDAGKPWCCDLGGINLGRLRGWRPDWADGLGYYDAVNMAKRIKCETFITSGLGDYVCPPSGISVLYNNIKAPKTIVYIQGSTHGYDPPNPKTQRIISK